MQPFNTLKHDRMRLIVDTARQSKTVEELRMHLWLHHGIAFILYSGWSRGRYKPELCRIRFDDYHPRGEAMIPITPARPGRVTYLDLYLALREECERMSKL